MTRSRTRAKAAPQKIALKPLRRSMASYHGAQTGTNPRIGSWMPFGGSADYDTVMDLDKLRPRVRDCVRNIPIAAGAVSCDETHVIGTGLTLQPAIDGKILGLTEDQVREAQDLILSEWLPWAESVNCDASRRMTFYGLQAQAERAEYESGDVITVLPNIGGRGVYQTAIQNIEADRLSNPGRGRDTDRMVAGVEMDAWGAPVAYHICRSHPGSGLRQTDKWDAVPAFGSRTGRRNVIHFFKPLRPGQTRGVPMLAPVVEHIKQLGRYGEAELNAAVISAVFAVFMKMDPEAFSELFDTEGQTAILDQARKWNGELSSGKAVNLLPGEEPVPVTPGRPNAAFDAFVDSIVTQIGMAVGIPKEVLTMRFTSSYSAARSALLQAWRTFRMRRDRFATYWCAPIYQTWFEEAVLLGRIKAPGFFSDDRIRYAWTRAQWVGDGPGSIDPDKEITAAQKRIESGISTIATESLLYDGVPWDVKNEQRRREVEARRDAGLDQGQTVQDSPADQMQDSAQQKDTEDITQDDTQP